MSLVKALSAHLPGARLQPGGTVARLVFEHEGVWLHARVREAPKLELFVRTIDLHGTAVRVTPTHRRLGTVPTRRSSDGYSYTHDDDIAPAVERARAALDPDLDYVQTATGPLAGVWFDRASRAALGAALWSQFEGEALTPAVCSNGYRFESTATEIVALRDSEYTPDRAVRALHAAASLASRPHRIGRTWLDVARALGGTTTEDQWDVGGAFAATFERGPAEVRIDNVLRLRDDDRVARLATRLRARRIAPDGDAWSLTRDAPPWELPKLPRLRAVDVPGLPDAWTARATAPERAAARLRARVPLLLAAAPLAAWGAGDEIGMVWDDLAPDPARLGPAIELAAALAFEADAAVGPYR